MIELDTGDVESYDFGLTQDARRDLFDRAKNKAYAELAKLSNDGRLRRDRSPEIEAQLRELCNQFAKAIGQSGPLTRTDGSKTARASITIEAYDRDFRRVVCTHNFEGDNDGDLVLPKYAGLTGAAWLHPGQVFWADLRKVRNEHSSPNGFYTFGLSPEIQNRVRPKAEAMAAVAITADGTDEPVATLACDTDVPILSNGSEEEVRQVRMAAEEALVLASRYLAPILGRLYTDR
jgi:hypothetical protein